VGWIVGKKEPEKERGKQSYYPFNDEEPAKSFESCGSINVADAVGDGTTERSCEVAKGDDKSDTNSAFVVPIPYRYEVDNS
jgi:hypothetical protein